MIGEALRRMVAAIRRLLRRTTLARMPTDGDRDRKGFEVKVRW